ncbi:hypothetical protein Q4520_17660 [Alteromonas sp. 1_MG-2023]|uniref:DUF418 domain-containing protein n=1 Tax=Alteromonas sp. 1_MG-2023 TaxID=3062669 RepID=UPI0026E33C2C|nr:DUF418 domain-containing protein [Alteromonas sp. 1_MG-2023]MDO6477251.1 hypothetical protein [Alteromonas sp. 1_MG-2023]
MEIHTLKKHRKRYGWVFLTSSIIYVISIMSLTIANTTIQGPKELPLLISLLSLLTSLATLIGFISTTILAWRKENREKLHSDLDIKKKELEIEKLRQEIKKKDA